jgi:hypothetical protein
MEKGVCFYFLFWIYTTVCWIINLVRFVSCDFVEPFREEVIYGLGVLIPPISWVTVWMNISTTVI